MTLKDLVLNAKRILQNTTQASTDEYNEALYILAALSGPWNAAILRHTSPELACFTIGLNTSKGFLCKAKYEKANTSYRDHFIERGTELRVILDVLDIDHQSFVGVGLHKDFP